MKFTLSTKTQKKQKQQIYKKQKLILTAVITLPLRKERFRAERAVNDMVQNQRNNVIDGQISTRNPEIAVRNDLQKKPISGRVKAKFPRIFVSGLSRNTRRNKKRLQKKSKALKKSIQKRKPLAIQPTILSVILRNISMRPNLPEKCATNLSTELLSAVIKA